MENSENIVKTNSNLKTAVAVLGILFLGSGAYIYKKALDAKLEKDKLELAENNVVKINSDLLKINSDLNAAITANGEKTEELKVQRQKVVDLINEVNSGKSTIAKLQSYKQRAEFLESRNDAMLQEIADLKRQNQILTVQRDSSVAALKAFKTSGGQQVVSGPNGFNNKNKVDSGAPATGTRKGMNADLAEKLYRIDIVNFATEGFNANDAPTTKASEVDYLKVSYNIPQSFVVRASERVYYIQIADPTGKFLGDNQTVSLEDGVNLNYSFIKKVDYKNRVMKVSENLKYNNLKKGKYTVKIFDKSRLVSTAAFELK
jgi:hypothetical protein